MSVIWSGITEQGAVVPVQVDASGKVIATAGVPDIYVERSGDTMTGPLVLPGDPTTDLQAATKQYVDSSSVPYNDMRSESKSHIPGFFDKYLDVNI